MLFSRIKRHFGRSLLISVIFWYLLLELFMFLFSSGGIALKDLLMPPYKERITDYDMGSRNQTWDNLSIARQLHGSVRIHCLLQLDSVDDGRKALHVLKTWGARCNRMHFSRALDVGVAYRRIARTQYTDLDWLLHVHVDSYVIMENLRYKLAAYAPDQLIYFSAFHAAYPYAHVGLKDTTDFIFSRGALQRLLNADCGDQNMAGCLANMTEGPNEQLFPFQVPAELLPFTLRSEFWSWPYIHRAVYTGQGFNHTTEFPILFPYATANQLHVLEFVLYHLRPYGHVNGMPALSQTATSLQFPSLAVNDSLAQSLFQEVRIICMLLTHPHRYEKVVRTIRQTWGRHCNKLIVFSSRTQRSVAGVQTVALNVSEGYDLLWGKAKAAFRHVYAQHRHEADWFFKADDDTYAIIDNMRYMLHSHRPEEPVYFGCKFRPDVPQGYMSGGAGYVLSREALRRLVEHGLQTGRCNQRASGTEDFEMGLCLSWCNVTAGDSRDRKGRHRFLPLSLEHMLIPGRMRKDFWLHKFMYHKLKEGLECCSTYAITIHYVFYYQMYLFEYFLYKMRPYGIIMGHEPRTQKEIGDKLII